MRAVCVLAMLVGMPLAASANDGFSVVIPVRPGVPILINGIDASYAVVEGDWGLAKNIQVQPTIFGGRRIGAERRVGHYYPSAGKMPGYGRLEREPSADRKPPPRAEGYGRSWSVQSGPPAVAEIPAFPPMVIEAPFNHDGPRRRPGPPSPR